MKALPAHLGFRNGLADLYLVGKSGQAGQLRSQWRGAF